MVFVDVRAILLGAFVADARAHDLAQTIEVIAFEAQAVLDLRTHILRPGLGAERADPQVDLVLGNPDLLHRFGQVEGVRRGTGDARDAEVADQAGVLLGVAGRGGHDRRTHHLHTVVGTQAAREQAVAIRDGEGVLTAYAIGGQTARHTLAPDADVLAGIAHDRGITGGAGRSVDADDFALRGGLQAEGIIVPQILLGREREFHDIIDRADVAWGEVHLLELVAVERDIVVDILHNLVQPLALQLSHLLAAHALFGGIPNHIYTTD